MHKTITVTDAVRSFSDIIGRVYYKGETYDIKRGANIVAMLAPAKAKSTITAGELNKFFKEAPSLSKEELGEFEEDIAKIKQLTVTGGLNKWD